MRHLVAIVIAIMAAVPTVASSKSKEPNFDYVLHVTGRFSIGHACPIAPDLVLISAHIVDPEPFNRNTPLITVRFETRTRDVHGFLLPMLTVSEMDISPAEPTSALKFYPIASAAPNKGDTLYYLLYDYRKPSTAFDSKVSSGTVVNVIAGMIVLDTEVMPGSSGGCVLNESGEVVGIVTAKMGMDNGSPIGIIDAVYGDWIDGLLAKVKELRAAEKAAAEAVQ